MASKPDGRRFPMYRCPPNGDCARRVSITAEIAERTVVEAVQGALADVHESASLDDGRAEAELALARCEAELDAAVQAFSGSTMSRRSMNDCAGFATSGTAHAPGLRI
jgi:hypothetical protein